MKRYIDLNEDFGLVPSDGKLTLTTKGLTLAAAQTKFPDWWKRWNARGKKVGWSDSKIQSTFMLNGMVTACANQAFFSRQAHPLDITTGSSCNVVVPWGEYETTACIYAAIGMLKGDGTFAHGTDMGSTVIIPAPKGKWNAEPDFPEGDARYSMGTAVIGKNGIMAYAESVEISHFRFEGNRQSVWYDSADKSSGLIYAGAGECSGIGKVQANSHNDYGIEVRQGTPAVIGYATVFNNNLAGIGLLGTALSTVQIGTVSADDNPYVFRMVGAPYGEPGGMVDIGLVKLEANTAPDGTPGFKDKDQCVGEVRGQAGVQIDCISAASGNSKSFSVFVVDCRLNNGTPQSCRISVEMCKNINFDNLVVDLYNRKRWPAPASYQNYSMEYDAANGGSVKVNGVEIPSLPYLHNDRLGVVSAGQNYDYVNYLPRWSFSGPVGTTPPVVPPVEPPTPPVDPPVVPPITPPTPPITPPVPPITPPVVPEPEPPTPPSTVKASWDFNSGSLSRITAQVGSAMTSAGLFNFATGLSGGKLRNNGANARNMRYNCSADGIRTVRLIGLVPFNVHGGQMILHSEMDYKGLVINGEGRICDNRSGDDKPLTDPLVAGQKVDLSITLPDGLMNVRFFGAHKGNGSSFQFAELDGLELL